MKSEHLINNCYLLLGKIKEDSVFEYWSAKSLFTANTFVLQFIKTPVSKLKPVQSQLLRDIFYKTSTLSASCFMYPFELSDYGGKYFFAFNELNGRLLSHYLQENSSVSFGIIMDIACNCLKALAILGRNNLFQGVLTLDNIIIKNVYNDSCKASLMNNYSYALFSHGIESEKEIIIKDLFSLGCILYKILFKKNYKKNDISIKKSAPSEIRKLITLMIENPKAIDIDSTLKVFENNNPNINIEAYLNKEKGIMDTEDAEDLEEVESAEEGPSLDYWEQREIYLKKTLNYSKGKVLKTELPEHFNEFFASKKETGKKSEWHDIANTSRHKKNKSSKTLPEPESKWESKNIKNAISNQEYSTETQIQNQNAEKPKRSRTKNEIKNNSALKSETVQKKTNAPAYKKTSLKINRAEEKNEGKIEIHHKEKKQETKKKLQTPVNKNEKKNSTVRKQKNIIERSGIITKTAKNKKSKLIDYIAENKKIPMPPADPELLKKLHRLKIKYKRIKREKLSFFHYMIKLFKKIIKALKIKSN